MSSSTNPVIVIVPGAWHVPAHYAHLALKLNAAGYTVDCLESSSTNDETKDVSADTDTWNDDIAMIRNAITSHTKAGRDVALVMHSFGGMTGSEAACGLGKREDESCGALIKLIYMTAFMVQEGQKRSDFGIDENWPNITALDDPENPKSLIPLDPLHFFYHDVPEQPSRRAIDNLRTHCPLSHVLHGPSKVAWRDIPTAYLVCEDDRAITAAAQEQMINAVKAQGVDVKVRRLKAGHSPFLSMPAETAKAIRALLEEKV